MSLLTLYAPACGWHRMEGHLQAVMGRALLNDSSVPCFDSVNFTIWDLFFQSFSNATGLWFTLKANSKNTQGLYAEQSLCKCNWPLNNTDLNWVGLFTYELFLVVDTTILYYPWLVEAVDAKPWVQRNHLYRELHLLRGSMVNYTPVRRVSLP